MIRRHAKYVSRFGVRVSSDTWLFHSAEIDSDPNISNFGFIAVKKLVRRNTHPLLRLSTT